MKGQELKIKMSESTICWKGQKVTVEGRDGQKIRLVYVGNLIQNVRLVEALVIKIYLILTKVPFEQQDFELVHEEKLQYMVIKIMWTLI